MIKSCVLGYFETFGAHLHKVECSDVVGAVLPIDECFERAACLVRDATAGDNKIMFIGNGGSAGIASHMAIDFSKNGNMRALAFNDPAALTCLGNDLGYDRVFEKQISLHARPHDVLIAISSSGKSANILNAVKMARAMSCVVISYSGFGPDNPLRRSGDLNFYLPSPEYGFVEIGHLLLIHAVLDLTMTGQLAARVPSLVAEARQ